MISIAVCDDEIIECCNMAKRIKEMMEEMKMPCIIRQFQSGRELLEALESFDIVFLDIIMQDLDGMKTAQVFRRQAFDKIRSQEHGIGLLNVGDVVHGYDGVLHVEAENGIFLISILMSFPDAAHNIKTAV